MLFSVSSGGGGVNGVWRRERYSGESRAGIRPVEVEVDISQLGRREADEQGSHLTRSEYKSCEIDFDRKEVLVRSL